MRHILLIEDEAVIRGAVAQLLERQGYRVTAAGSLEEADAATGFRDCDLIIADLRLPGLPGTEAIARAPGVPVLIVTSYASVRSAVEAMKLGAVDYIAKPFDHDQLLRPGGPHPETRRRCGGADRGGTGAGPGTRRTGGRHGGQLPRHAGDPPPHRQGRAYRKHRIDSGRIGYRQGAGGPRPAPTKPAPGSPLRHRQLRGDPGTPGRERDFGNEPTDAGGPRPGLVESADGGTLFLDEIGDLPAPSQARLLRLLQDGEVRSLGSERVRHLDLRLIASSNHDLKQLVQDGRFRSDLYFRLRVMEIQLPPLRERGEDLPELARYLLAKACSTLARPELALSARGLGGDPPPSLAG